MFLDTKKITELKYRPLGNFVGQTAKPARVRHAGCMHGENLRNPARVGCVGSIRWLPTGQVYSTTIFCILMQASEAASSRSCLLRRRSREI